MFSQLTELVNKERSRKRNPVKTQGLGKCPHTGKEIVHYIGRFGPVFKRGEKEYAGCPSRAPINLETAGFMFSLPKTLEDGAILKHGKFGFYVTKTSGKTASVTDLKTARALRTGNELPEKISRPKRKKGSFKKKKASKK